MSNEILWIGFALIDLSLVVVLFRLFGRAGLFALIVFNLLLCNIQVLKTVELFGLTATLGNVLYGSVFLATDLLSEFYGKKEAQKGVFLGFVTLGMGAIYMQIALLFTPAPDDFAQPLLQGIFGFMPRLAAASMAAYLVSQLHDVWAYHLLKKKTDGKMLWLRNTVSTLGSQFLDSAIFCVAAFWGVFEGPVLFEIFVTTYLFKAIVAGLDTPFIYIAKKFAPPSARTA